MSVRVPAIIETVLERNPDYARPTQNRLRALGEALRANEPLPDLDPALPAARSWQSGLAFRRGERWLATDWFFAENYAYRQLCEAVEFWQRRRDPFRPIKLADHCSAAHRAAVDAAASLGGATPEQRLELLLGACVFSNRMDLSFAPALARGTLAEADDLLVDDRRPAIRALLEGSGAIHLVLDNSGTELSVDLVLASELLTLAPVVLHVKLHPCFVSDVIAADVRWYVEADDQDARAVWASSSEAALAGRQRLAHALALGRLRVAPHWFWNSGDSLWDAPPDLAYELERARVVILKGDAHYRRALGDALWPPETPTSEVTGYFPTPLLLLRTLKSEPIVGLEPGRAAVLDGIDPEWRVNGQRGLAALGGRGGP